MMDRLPKPPVTAEFNAAYDDYYDRKDYEGAFPVFKAVAEKDDSPDQGFALYMLGLCYANGDGVEQDSRIGVLHLTRAAEQFQNPDAMIVLGNMYNLGEGVSVNPEEARRLHQAAADMGHPGAQIAMDMWSNFRA